MFMVPDKICFIKSYIDRLLEIMVSYLTEQIKSSQYVKHQENLGDFPKMADLGFPSTIFQSYWVVGLTTVPNSDYHNTITIREAPVTKLLLSRVLYQDALQYFQRL